MRKSSSPSLGNCNILANKIFGIALDELQQEGQPDHEVPFIVRHIVDYIEVHGGLEQEGLFQVNGNAETVEWLRQRYDNGEEVDLVKEADVPSAISLLRYFLQELPQPVILHSLHVHFMQLSQDYDNEEDFTRKLKYLLQQLPPVNYSLLKFLCRFLANVASHHEEIWPISALAAVFGPDVFHIYTDVEDMKEQESVSRIMIGLLESYYEFFETEEEDLSSTNDLSSITEQINDLDDDDDDKIEQPEEPSEDAQEEAPDVHVDMTEDILESSGVLPSTSSHTASISIIPQSTEVLERTIRAAVEQHLFDFQSSIDQDLNSCTVVQDSQGETTISLSEELHLQKDTTDDDANTKNDIHNSPETVICTYSEYQDSLPESEEMRVLSYQGQDMKSEADIFLEMTDEDTEDDGFIDEENDIESDRQDEAFMECNRDLPSSMDSNEICDYNANSELQMLKPGNSSSRGESVSIQHLELRSISDDDLEEPFPAFKAWQGDPEYGEAQISPQAARMNYRVDDDFNPVLSHRSLDFGQSQRFLHDPEKLDSSSMELFYVRTRRASFSSKDDKKPDKTPYQLVKKLHKKIRQYEEQFELEKKPTYSDIAANPKVLKWMTDLTKLKKQIKDAKHKITDVEFLPQTRPRSNTLPKSFGSSLDQEDEANEVPMVDKKPSQEATLELILKKLKESRMEKGLPEEMNVKMTKDNLAEEKTSLQKSLLYYESLHGRPVTREERQIVKPLYDRYRLVKQMLARASITPILGSPSTKRRGQMLPPIIEGETSHFFDEIKEEEEESGSLSSDYSDTIIPSIHIQSIQRSEESFETEEEKITRDIRLTSSRTTSMSELLEQLWKARAEKKKLRKTLREFEEDFYQQNGRNVQKDDRAPMLDVYREYKKIKAKLRLLEVLISKQDSSKSI
ncbi:protein FAM13B isoform 2-T3 [Discoglossus pictus]